MPYFMFRIETRSRALQQSLATFVQYKDILVIVLVGKSTFVTQNVEI